MAVQHVLPCVCLMFADVRLGRVLTYLHTHSQTLNEQLQQLDSFCKLDAGLIITAFDSLFSQQSCDLPNNPRSQTVSSGQIAYSTSDAWFACSSFDPQQPVAGDSPTYLHRSDPINLMNRQHLGSLLCFRVGAHDLGIAVGQWHNVPRHDRLWARCTTGLLDDEVHMVFECPSYASVRERFAVLFTILGGDAHTWASLPAMPDSDTMRRFMHQNPGLVAAFVHTCWRLRAEPDIDPEVLSSSPDVLQAIDTPGS